MSEPTTISQTVEEVVPGVLHWSIDDDRIKIRSESYAIRTPEGTVLIDPLPLSEEALRSLAPVRAIVLTVGRHQRAAWRLRAQLGAAVHAPRGAEGLDQQPDVRYTPEAGLPGGLTAFATPGAGADHHVLRYARAGGADVLFVGDLFMQLGPELGLLPDSYSPDPAALRRDARMVAALDRDIVCPAHGGPIRAGGAAALRTVVESLGAS